MDFRQAVMAMAGSGKSDSEAVDTIYAAVEPLCKTSTDSLEDWLSGTGGYTGKETPKQIAKEWDSLSD